MVLADSNVLRHIFVDDPIWRPWSERMLREVRLDGLTGTNPGIYAETSLAFERPSDLDKALESLTLTRLPLPYGAGFATGRAFLKCRRSGGARILPMPDFYIGAHAEIERLRLLTRDSRRYRTYLPNASLISPDAPAGAGANSVH